MTSPSQEDASPTWYVTTSIPYVNARPHLGHALEFILTDALARYHRLAGDRVWFLTGTDENSLKNVRAAEREGIPTQVLVDRNAAHFQHLREPLNLSYDDFIRTSKDRRHLEGVRKLWDACAQRGDIYQRAYRGLYCVGCEQFYSEAELSAGCCPVHLTRPEVVEEDNYFFRLSHYADRLRKLIASDQLHIVPGARKNEALSFIESGLEDFSISRSRARARDWGIPVPGDAQQVMYVWFDALGNYITALDYAGNGPLYHRFWRQNPQRIHVIGKDIQRFHTIYWPALLLSAGIPLPTAILVHGFITLEGGKMSKSVGNIIDPGALVERYGTDALRYYLLREIRATEDGDFSLERFTRTYHRDLADQLGNLLNRVVTMVSRYAGGVVPAPGVREELDQRLVNTAEGLRERVEEAMAQFAPHEALFAIWELVSAANKYVSEVEPWTLARQRASGPERVASAERLATILYNLTETLRLIAHYCVPFLPTTAELIAHQLGVTLETSGAWRQVSRWGAYLAGTAVQPGEVLFPRLELLETS
jgi:methionyl-tRNA synthetase